VSGAGAGGAGSLPSGLEGHGHGLAAGAAEPKLVGVSGLSSGLHDAGTVEAAVSLHKGDLAEADQTFNAATGAEEVSRNLHAVGAEALNGGGLRKLPLSSHRPASHHCAIGTI